MNSYRERVSEWFEAFDAAPDQEEASGDPDSDSATFGDTLNQMEIGEASEIILRYHTLIGAKLWRAVRGKLRADESWAEEMTRDFDGSAKVALICIDRSMAAWWRLLALLPDEKRQIAGFLASLKRLRTTTEQAFPDAWAFLRSGFDDNQRC